MEITLREGTESDFVSIVNLFKEFADFEKLPEKMTNSVDRMIKEKEFFHCFVAETGNKEIIGYVTYNFCYYTWLGKSLYMDDLYVTGSHRGKGIGRKLLEHVIDYAKKTGCHKLRWQVSDWNNQAIDFYKSIGAEIEDKKKDCDLILN